MSKPFFSVIIPTFNRSKSLKRAIDSVLGQTYQDFELIIVDDGSTDNTKEIIDTEKMKYLFQENRGVSSARNLGIGQSRGRWIALLDSDDEWLENKLELQFNFIRSNEGLRCVHGDEIWIRNGVRVNQMKKHKKGGGDQFIPSLDLCLISPSCVVLRKDLFEDIGDFREDFPVCEDYDLWLKLTALEEIGYIDKPLIKKYGGHEDQLSQKFFAMDYWRVLSLCWVFENIADLDKLKLEALVCVLRKKLSILIKGYVKHKNLKKVEELSLIQSKYNLN